MGNQPSSEEKPAPSLPKRNFRSAPRLRDKNYSEQLRNTSAAENTSQNSTTTPPEFQQERNSDTDGFQPEQGNIFTARRQRIDSQPGNTSTAGRSYSNTALVYRPVRRRGQLKDLKYVNGALPQKLGNVEASRNLVPGKIEPLDGRTASFQAVSTTSTTEPEEKCYDPSDPTLELFHGDDDTDFLFNDYKSLRAKMSCGHTVTPMSLTNWCRHLLEEDQSKFVCGQPGCDVEWTYDEVYRMALLTPEEKEYFEKTLNKITIRDFLDVKQCPGCKSSAVRANVNDLRVVCTECTAKKKRKYEFCWQCLKEWTRPSPHTNRCANPECVNKQEELLRKCKAITFKDVKGVTGCPSIRACPTCGMLIEHSKKQCKNIVCPRCKVEFCFVCLRLSGVCGTYYEPCSVGIAPRQTTIPEWKK